MLLPTRASLMLDVVFLAMFLVLPLLAWSIYLVRRRNYALHKRVQLALGSVLLLAVALFEVDMQLFTDWEQLAQSSPYFPTWVKPVLWVHLFFAVPTALLWLLVIVRALRRFPNPPGPSPHSREHIFWAWLASFETIMTAVTGWTFYWLAFVA